MPVVCTFEQRVRALIARKRCYRNYRIYSNRLSPRPTVAYAILEHGEVDNDETTMDESAGSVGESKNMHKYAGAQRLHVDGIGDGRVGRRPAGWLSIFNRRSDQRRASFSYSPRSIHSIKSN